MGTQTAAYGLNGSARSRHDSNTASPEQESNPNRTGRKADGSILIRATFGYTQSCHIWESGEREDDWFKLKKAEVQLDGTTGTEPFSLGFGFGLERRVRGRAPPHCVLGLAVGFRWHYGRLYPTVACYLGREKKHNRAFCFFASANPLPPKACPERRRPRSV